MDIMSPLKRMGNRLRFIAGLRRSEWTLVGSALTAILRSRRNLLVFLVSGICGGIFGMWKCDWQVAVEPAQVIAGLVKYPPGNPFYIYQVKLWNILHQLAAIGLKLGLTEGNLSLMISLVAGVVAFSGIALCTLAFSDNAIFAVLMPFFVYRFTMDWGVNYPLMLVGQSHTYGMLGLTVVFLATALLGTGEFKWGAFVLALAPAFHASLGIWGAIVILIAAAWDYRAMRPHLRSMLVFGLAGGLITAASLGYHLGVTYRVPSIDPELARRYFETFVRYWDEHRVALDMTLPAVMIAVFTAALSLMALQLPNSSLPAPARLLMRCLVVSATMGLGLTVVNQYAWQLPDWMMLLMPSRLLNFNNLAYLPLLLGLMWQERERLWAQANLIFCLLLFYLIAVVPPEQLRFFGWSLAVTESPDQMRVFLLAGAAFMLTLGGRIGALSVLLAYLGVVFLLQSADTLPVQGVVIAITFLLLTGVIWIIRKQAEGRSFLKWTPAAILALAAIHIFSQAYDYHYSAAYLWESRAMLDEVPRGEGLIATGAEMNKIQLYTRRPVLLDTGALDMLPYAPEGGPEFERILREVYGIDFFGTTDGMPVLPVEGPKSVWENRSLEEWQAIRRAYNVDTVMTTTDWNLQLPKVGQTTWNYLVYQIP